MSRQIVVYYLSILGVNCAPDLESSSPTASFTLPLLYPVTLGPFLVGGAGTKSTLLKQLA